LFLRPSSHFKLVQNQNMPGMGGLRTPSNSRRMGDSQIGHTAALACSRATGSVIFFQPSKSCVHYSSFYQVRHLSDVAPGSIDKQQEGRSVTLTL
jgi:hypothetical protein